MQSESIGLHTISIQVVEQVCKVNAVLQRDENNLYISELACQYASTLQ